MKTALVIPHYHANRIRNVEHTVRQAQMWKVRPDEIIIFNNNPDYSLRYQDIAKNITVINASRNFGSSVRYGIATVCFADIVVFQDDDLLLSDNAFGNLVDAVKQHPQSIVGMIGGDFKKGVPYREKTHVVEGECHFILGRVSAMRRELLLQGLSLIYQHTELKDACKNHEDIPMSVANVLAGHKNRTIPLDFQELDDGGVGLEKHGNHYTLRDSILKAVAEGVLR